MNWREHGAAYLANNPPRPVDHQFWREQKYLHKSIYRYMDALSQLWKGRVPHPNSPYALTHTQGGPMIRALYREWHNDKQTYTDRYVNQNIPWC